MFSPAITNAATEHIGPNALTQTARALGELLGEAEASTLLWRAELGWIVVAPPQTMVAEQTFFDLTTLVTAELGPIHSRRLLWRAGNYTAAYLLCQRIPQPFQRLLCLLPHAPRCWLLLRAMQRHAWTFVGAGHFAYQLRPPALLRIVRASPIPPAAYSFYGGTFEHLLRALVDQTVTLDAVLHADGRGCNYWIR